MSAKSKGPPPDKRVSSQLPFASPGSIIENKFANPITTVTIIEAMRAKV